VPSEAVSNQEVGANVSPELRCSTCSKIISGEPHVEILDGKKYNFDSQECARMYRKMKSLYGEYYE
jgi:hypothetical protein